jgi:DNA repair exonuclease SbcCD ATPase subunit
MTSKAELFDELETLGFDCGRNSRYTVGMLAQIRDSLQKDASLLVDQAVRLTMNRQVSNEQEETITYLNQQCIALKKVRDHDAEVLKNKNMELKELEDMSKWDAKMYLNLETKFKELQATHTEKEFCHDRAHENLNKALKKHTSYEGYIEQLNEEMKELRREAKNNRKKNKKLEKKSNESPPTYEPPKYENHP